MLEPRVDLYTVAIPPPVFYSCDMYKILAHLKPSSNNIFDHVSACSFEHIGRLVRMSVLDTKVDGSNPGSSMLFP